MWSCCSAGIACDGAYPMPLRIASCRVLCPYGLPAVGSCLSYVLRIAYRRVLWRVKLCLLDLLQCDNIADDTLAVPPPLRSRMVIHFVFIVCVALSSINTLLSS